VVEEAAPDFTGAIETFQAQRALLFAALRGELLERERARIAPDIVWNIEKGLNVTADELLRAERQRARIFRSVAEFFETHDLLACPVVAVAPFPVEQRFPTEIGGEKLATYIDWMFLTFVLTLTGCPAISIPCGFTNDGRPVGLQLMGRPRGEHELLAAAAAAEALFGLASRLPVEPS
jgi:amidase